MKKFIQYFRDEWTMWVAAFIFLMFWCGLTSAHAAPTLKTQVEQAAFYQDEDNAKWYLVYQEHIVDMNESFDYLKVLWHGQYKGHLAILVSGQEGHMCETKLRLYWFKAPKDIVQFNQFNTCFAKEVHVGIHEGTIHIQIDGRPYSITVD